MEKVSTKQLTVLARGRGICRFARMTAYHAGGDLLSESLQKLEPLRADFGGGGSRGDEDQLWVEETEEKAQIGKGFCLAALEFINGAGNADAQFSLGQYHYSRGNYETALTYFSSAEAGGSAQASYQLGVMFYDGLGAPQNPVSSLAIVYSSFTEVQFHASY